MEKWKDGKMEWKKENSTNYFNFKFTDNYL